MFSTESSLYFRALKSKHIELMCFIVSRSGTELDGSTFGSAYVRTMCNDRLSVGVTQDGGRYLTRTGAVAAHHLGHIFNMQHDGVNSIVASLYLYITSRSM